MTVYWKLVALAMLAAVPGCAYVEGLMEPPGRPAPPPAAPVVAEPAPADVPLPTRKPAPPLQALLTPPIGPTPSTPSVGADRLVNLTPEDTIALFGEPSSRSERYSGIVWSYVRPDCELDLLFFMNVQTRVSRVLDYDLRTGDGTERSRQRCLEQLALDRRARDAAGSSRPR